MKPTISPFSDGKRSAPNQILQNRDKFWKGFAFAACLSALLWTATMAGADPVIYYVDNTIADTHVANATPDFTTYDPVTFSTSTGTASVYKTIADVNTLHLSPGDRVLFRKGQMWRGLLTVPASGRKGSPITYGAFGSGMAPIINGSDVVSAWTDNTTAGVANTWSAAMSTEPKIVLFNGTIGTQVGSVAACDADKKWYWADNKLYTYGTVNPNTTYPGQIEAGQRDYTIKMSGKNYITVTGIHATKANKVGICLDAYGADAIGVSILGNLLDYNAEGGMWAIAYVGTISDLLVSDNEAAFNGAFGMRGNAPDATGSLTNSTWSHNLTHHNCWSSQIDYAGMKWFGRYVKNQIIEHNESHHNGAGRTYTGNTGWGIYVDTVGSGNIIRYNKVYGNLFDGFNIEKSTGVKLYYNLSYGQTTGAGIQVDTDVHNNEIYNNVCYGNRDGIWITSWESKKAGGVTGNLVKNNILAGNESRALRVLNGGENDGTNGSGNVYTYNALGLAVANFIEWGSSVYKLTYAAWETAYGGTTHSVQADPLFISTSDFHLNAASPCINAGVNVGLTIDYAGNEIRGLPDIGAYEYRKPNR